MGVSEVKRAVFLDRDGVINRLVYNPNTKEYESPHNEKDLNIFPGAFEALKLLQDAGFLLFLVSNQPSYAKGKTSLENIKSIHKRLHDRLLKENIIFTEYFYCYHHPQGIVSGYSGKCECRKPKPWFVLYAKKKYGLDITHSWFVGDQDTDILCGKNAGIMTIGIQEEHSKHKRKEAVPDFWSKNLREAVKIVEKNRRNSE